MNNNLLIIGAGEYGMMAKEIAEEMGCFEKIDFLDVDFELAVGKIDNFESMYSDYGYAIATCEDGDERVAMNHRLEEALYVIPVLAHPKSIISSSANLMKGCMALPGAVVELQTTVGIGSIIGANCVVEHHCFIGDGCLLKAGTIVRANSVVAGGSVTEYGSVLWKSLN